MGKMAKASGEDDQSRKICLKRGLGEVPEDPVCDSGIFCYGPLLEAVQMAAIYPDSKTFVDKKLKLPPGKIIKNFETLLNQHNGSLLSVDEIKKFVEDHFDEEGHELEPWVPEDWTPEPEFIANLRKPALRNLAKRIARLWRDLSRKIKDDVKDNPELYSIIYVPNGFVVPGGRFREFYYWDTYWIVKALLHYDMTTTVRGIIENFLLMVKTYGLVPNGGRIYYTKRSQPPFLTLMMKEYIDKTADVQFLRTQLPTLVREMEFWEVRRSVEIIKDGKRYTLFTFGTGGTGPRPESYKEDVESAEVFETEAEREEFYYHMKAGAESGWDYSTRWFINKEGGNSGSLKNVRTSSILPVDLNALIYMDYMAISEFFSLLGDSAKSEEFSQKAAKLKEAIQAVLFVAEDSMWYDYDLENDKSRKYFYPSNLFPLWAECYDIKKREDMANSALKYLRKTGAIRCKGGVPTSMMDSGQQWDFPNAWPPLQHILVAGLLKTESPDARKMALTIARRYTNGAIFSCPDGAEVCNMFEKYNVNDTGSAGGGGEYDVQTGFGWTNGVIIDFMVIFGDDLLSDEEDVELMEGKKNIEVDLNTQFNLGRGKSILRRRESNMTIVKPEKHELETSEKCIHPALAIEEDDQPQDLKAKIQLFESLLAATVITKK